jgi:hypothetical protein
VADVRVAEEPVAEGLVADDVVDEGAAVEVSFAVGDESVFRASAASGVDAGGASDFVSDFVSVFVTVCDLFSDVGEE